MVIHKRKYKPAGRHGQQRFPYYAGESSWGSIQIIALFNFFKLVPWLKWDTGDTAQPWGSNPTKHTHYQTILFFYSISRRAGMFFDL